MREWPEVHSVELTAEDTGMLLLITSVLTNTLGASSLIKILSIYSIYTYLSYYLWTLNLFWYDVADEFSLGKSANEDFVVLVNFVY